VAADALLSTSAVSFFWPLETHWSTGHSGWQDIFGKILRGDDQDAWISLGAAAVIMIHRAVRTLNAGRLMRTGSKGAGG
jgi:hypothetical protein